MTVTRWSPKKTKLADKWHVRFLADDIELFEDNDNDPILILAMIGNYHVEWILTDNRSVVEILSYSAF